MAARVSHTTVDGLDPHQQSLWRSEVLALTEDPNDPDRPGHGECPVSSPEGGLRLLFIQVPEAKAVKNRLHLDLVPTDGTRDEELEQLLGLGAREVADRRRPDGTGWVVLADPEGDEFCILRSDAERAAGSDRSQPVPPA